MTIGEYFAKEKRYDVRFPNLPCVHVGPRDKSIIVPMEVSFNYDLFLFLSFQYSL